MIGRNDPCWCGSGEKWKKCHYPRVAPPGEGALAESYAKRYQIRLKTPEEQERLRRAGHFAASVLDAVGEAARAGVTTRQLEELALELFERGGARSASLHYGTPPFPGAICTSRNEVICHGIPDDIPLIEGDILNIDVACILDGYYGDCSKMVSIGTPSEERQRVVETSYACLMGAIALLKPGLPICAIGARIVEIATERGCSVVHQFVGHGLGRQFHEPPQVPHHKTDLAIPLAPGMVFTIEPMINAGVAEAVIDAKDEWTARTQDGKASAQWEHTLLITEEGCEILTPWRAF